MTEPPSHPDQGFVVFQMEMKNPHIPTLLQETARQELLALFPGEETEVCVLEGYAAYTQPP